MNKRIMATIMLLLSVLVLSGCWDRRESEELLLVDAMAIDIIDREGIHYYQITLVSTKPSGDSAEQGMGSETGGGGGTTTQWVASSQGRTLEEALLNFTTRTSRYIYFEHNTLILIGEDMARAGVSEILDFLIRNKDIRLRNNILVTRGNALNLLSTTPGFEKELSSELKSILDRGSKQGDFLLPIDLNIFSQSVLTPGQDPWAPLIDTFQPTEAEEAMEDKVVRVEETALFRSDKLAGFLTQQETQGMVILQNMASRGSFVVSFRESPVSFIYEEVNVSRTLLQRGNKVEVDYQVTLNGEIEEIHTTTMFSDQELNELESLLARTAQGNLELTIAKCQELGADAFGIGRGIHIQHPSIWKSYISDWEDIFTSMVINIKVRVEIVGTSLGFKPITPNGE